MDRIKKKMIGFVCLLVIGVVFLAVGIIRSDDSILVAIGVAYIVCAAIRFVQYYRLTKNEEKRNEYEMLQTEERTVFLAEKARSVTFVLSVGAEFIGGVIAFLIGKESIGINFFYVAGIQSFVYLLCYSYYSKKY